MSLLYWSELWPDLVRLLIAFVLALPVGWERTRSTQLMGVRTFPLVAVASCAYVLLGISFTGDNADAKARIIQGLMSGIGFIGGGAIVKQGGSVEGTATAASVWTIGAAGAAVALDRYEVAIIAIAINFIVLQWFTPLKEALQDADS